MSLQQVFVCFSPLRAASKCRSESVGNSEVIVESDLPGGKLPTPG